jgi:hypothetical protein
LAATVTGEMPATNIRYGKPTCHHAVPADHALRSKAAPTIAATTANLSPAERAWLAAMLRVDRRSPDQLTATRSRRSTPGIASTIR